VILELSEAVLEVGRDLRAAIDVLRATGPAIERLEELERTRAMWEAEMEALVLKADSTLKASSNAESRSRTMLRHADKLADPFADDSDEVEALDPPRHVENGEAEEVQVLSVGLERNSKAHALRAKWTT